MKNLSDSFNPRRRRFVAALASASLLLGSRTTCAAEGYDSRAEVQQFMREMSAKHGLDPDDLSALFAHTQYRSDVIRAIMPPRDPRIRSWRAYRPRYVNEQRIRAGTRFWDDHAAMFQSAAKRFGVPEEIIAAIIGVETIYGRMTGNIPTLSALATLAFDYPPRAELFRTELEELLLMARDTGRSALTFKGSYAGALGLPQFLPSSYRRFAVDFDGNGKKDLDSPADAIGSVANFLREHGWHSGRLIAVPAFVPPAALPLADGGVLPVHGMAKLTELGVRATETTGEEDRCALIDLVSPDQPTEYWLGFDNFYVLTRYNRSSFYAMAVFHLSVALRNARGVSAG
ncbi:MAG: lytic murein transglycosylase B [Rhodocyclaceae bacterium]